MLLEPQHYLESLQRKIQLHKEIYGGKCEYTKNWRLELRKYRNRHPTTDGKSWGWYNIDPINFSAGFWEQDGRDDLKDVDIDLWNAIARELKP